VRRSDLLNDQKTKTRMPIGSPCCVEWLRKVLFIKTWASIHDRYTDTFVVTTKTNFYVGERGSVIDRVVNQTGNRLSQGNPIAKHS
jgi:hypothetical protein